MTKLLLLAAAMALAASIPAQKDDKDSRMKWFREARFGMFIHWGLYSIPAGKWGNSTGYGEWIRESAHIPVGEYEKFQSQFNPTKFDADAWAKLAKRAGMKYVVITTKHHDGFGLFKSKLTDWDIEGTPYKKDIMAEIARAYRAQGFHIGWYHSIMDWHHPDYLPRRTWEVADRPNGNADFDRYNRYLQGQVSELLTNYGKIDLMWFDGEWESTWNHKYGQSLYDLCRKLQPQVIVNNRVDVGRGGMGGMSDAGFAGDYGTPEQEVPEKGLPGVDWESCITTNDHWGYNAWDKNFKSGQELVRLLIDVVSKGGNLLLNVGPRSDGTLPPEQVERLEHIGKWMAVNGEAIYATKASPLGHVDFGRCTAKGKNLYLHVYAKPKKGILEIPKLGSKIASASVLGQGKVPVSLGDHGVRVDLTKVKFDPDATVVKLTLAEDLKIFNPPNIARTLFFTNGESIPFVGSTPVVMSPGSKGFKTHYTLDGSEPTVKSPFYQQPLTLTKSTTVTARNSYNGRMVGEAKRVRFEAAKVLPAVLPTANVGEFYVTRYEGNFDKCDDMKNGRPVSAQREIALGEVEKEEHVGLAFDGYISATVDDIYKFDLLSDDGSRLFVDGKLVVDNDGLHGPTEKSGIVALAKGMHRIRVEWFNKTGGAVLKLNWAQRK